MSRDFLYAYVYKLTESLGIVNKMAIHAPALWQNIVPGCLSILSIGKAVIGYDNGVNDLYYVHLTVWCPKNKYHMFLETDVT